MTHVDLVVERCGGNDSWDTGMGCGRLRVCPPRPPLPAQCQVPTADDQLDRDPTPLCRECRARLMGDWGTCFDD